MILIKVSQQEPFTSVMVVDIFDSLKAWEYPRSGFLLYGQVLQSFPCDDDDYKNLDFDTRPPLDDGCGEWGTNMAARGEIWEENWR